MRTRVLDRCAHDARSSSGGVVRYTLSVDGRQRASRRGRDLSGRGCAIDGGAPRAAGRCVHVQEVRIQRIGAGSTSTCTLVSKSSSPDNHFFVTRIKTSAGRRVSRSPASSSRARQAQPVLETAWNSEPRRRGRVRFRLRPSGSCLGARGRRPARRARGSRYVSRGQAEPAGLPELLAHHTATAWCSRLWVLYRPDGGRGRQHGFHGLHLPTRWSSVRGSARTGGGPARLPSFAAPCGTGTPSSPSSSRWLSRRR